MRNTEIINFSLKGGGGGGGWGWGGGVRVICKLPKFSN